jgi:hypothetical protein
MKKTKASKPRPGRPATGVTKKKISVTIDKVVWEKVIAESSRLEKSKAQIVEKCLRCQLFGQCPAD